MHMVMEKGDMDLEKYLHLNKNMKEDRIQDLWKQMLCAVDTIHKQEIIHTDLKPANFLFVDSLLKLIDFGIAEGLQVIFRQFLVIYMDCSVGKKTSKI